MQYKGEVKMIFQKKLGLVALMVFLFGCSTFDFSRVAKLEDTVAEQSARLDKEQATVSARIDEYEFAQSRLTQRIQLLEKALMLGLPLSELMDDSGPLAPRVIQPKVETSHSPVPLKSTENGELPTKLPKNTIADESRRNILIEAQAHFDSGRFGRAILEYEKLNEDDNQIYWVALSWLRLKDFLKAEEGFRKIIEEYPQSRWLARSRFYLAQMDFDQGFQNRALSQMRQIIADYPDEEAAQLARGAISQYERKL
jgi:TolA-binding protein